MAATAPQIGAGDRLGFTVFIAAIIHAALIFGIHISAPEHSLETSQMRVTVAVRNEENPDEADFLAQSSQQGAGSEDEALELNAAQLQQIAEQGRANDQQLGQRANDSAQLANAWRQSSSFVMLLPAQAPTPLSAERIQIGEGSLSPQIAILEARVHELQQLYAQRPRVRTLTSVSTKAAADAAYLERWRQQVEDYGNANYPPEARARRLFGNLRLKVSVLANGSLQKVELLQSSGVQVLDRAAMDIVREAAPYPPFPDSIRSSTDQLDIIRTWRFEPSGRLGTQ
ncbi:energy transducer TonB [Umboniibacter marinipuniceus]|uniref:Protein TonB n=1 Tax=Umboniibacter marinipuniceus TaxID=569599 RepID=A0A3M0ADM5_9GAMM|nr:energy transducer TonB [Umboniibacter marinipuniceus]RMA82224.1 protein TonB [Umboniibacter marinipuniceus]